GASTLTLVTVEALSWRSSNAVARTAMGPAPASVVSSRAWLRLEDNLPPLATNVTLTGRLSGLVASQVIVELSPMRTLAGDAEPVIFGGAPPAAVSVDAAGGGTVAPGFMGCISGADDTSMSSTPSPT